MRGGPYSRFTERLTVAGDTPKDLATRRWLTPLATISMTAASCSSNNRRGAPSFLPSVFVFSKPALVRRRMDTSSWSDTQAAKPASDQRWATTLKSLDSRADGGTVSYRFLALRRSPDCTSSA